VRSVSGAPTLPHVDGIWRSLGSVERRKTYAIAYWDVDCKCRLQMRQSAVAGEEDIALKV
ncbi:MAG: hypothetical protein ABIK79_11225, partial [Chloroflexota bacterium]